MLRQNLQPIPQSVPLGSFGVKFVVFSNGEVEGYHVTIFLKNCASIPKNVNTGVTLLK